MIHGVQNIIFPPVHSGSKNIFYLCRRKPSLLYQPFLNPWSLVICKELLLYLLYDCSAHVLLVCLLGFWTSWKATGKTQTKSLAGHFLQWLENHRRENWGKTSFSLLVCHPSSPHFVLKVVPDGYLQNDSSVLNRGSHYGFPADKNKSTNY